MNNVCLVGRIATGLELKYTTSNIATTRFNVAINRQYSNAEGQREADFIPVRAWRKQAENVCNYLNKGSLVSISGRIQTGSYTDKDGNRRNTFEVVADSVQFLESKNKNTQDTVNNLQTTVNDSDPFAEFGEQVSTDDNFLE